MNGLRALARYVGPSRDAAAAATAVCELCGTPVPPSHDHVVDREQRDLQCACRACALLFDTASVDTRYRTVPDRVLTTRRPLATEAAWAATGIPVQLAFVFFHSKLERWIAVYPSPAGPVESEPDAEAWRRVTRGSALVEAIEPDVEALVVHGRRGGEPEYFVAPIADCYALVASVRRQWRGFDGGDEARDAIEAFFDGLRTRARIVGDRGEER